MIAKYISKENLSKLYLLWFNEAVTVEEFASQLGVYERIVHQIINEGRKINNEI